jgi:D-arabinose 1-dehydrogenase-like Zn-dependent alcohol dehydrogenase
MLDFATTHGIGAVVDVMAFARVNDAIGRISRRDVATSVVLES